MKQGQKVEEAVQVYFRAIELYIEEKNNVGLAYTYAELCDAYCILGQREQVIKAIKCILYIYDEISYDEVKTYVNNHITESVQIMGISIEEFE